MLNNKPVDPIYVKKRFNNNLFFLSQVVSLENTLKLLLCFKTCKFVKVIVNLKNNKIYNYRKL